MKRNALFLLGGRGARFMEHIASTVPRDLSIVVPSVHGYFSSQNILQFFLMPRGIPTCPCGDFLDHGDLSKECESCLRKEDHAVPAIGPFPPEEIFRSKKVFIPFHDSGWYRGVYVETSFMEKQSNAFIEMDTPLSLALILDLLMIMIIVMIGFSLAFVIDKNLDVLEYLLLSLPLGGGFLTLSIFLLSWIGIKISSLLYILIAVPAIVFLTYQNRKYLSTKLHLPTLLIVLKSIPNLIARQKHKAALFVVFLFLFLSSTVISIGRGYSLFDGIANWALKGYGIALDKSIYSGQTWGGHSLDYPQNLPLQIALFRLIDGDVLPGSKILFPLYAVSVLAGCFAYLRKYLRPELAAIPPLLIYSTPFFFLHSTIGWSNLFFSTYIVLAVLQLALGYKTADNSKYTFGGLLLAFAVWTRPEGIGYAVAIALFFIFMNWLGHKNRSILWMLPIFIVSTIWLTFSYSSIRQGEIGQTLSQFIDTIQSGDLALDHFTYLVRYSYQHWKNFDTWGALFYSLVPLIIVTILKKRPLRDPSVYLVALCGVVAILIPNFMFFVATYAKENIEVFLDVSFNRTQFHGGILLLVSLYLGAFHKPAC
jgi:hypothetical protein